MLELQGPLTLTAGLKPNVWSAKCSYVEFNKLGGQVNLPGTIGLWYSVPPPAAPAGPFAGQPDVSIEDCRICDVQVGEIGEVIGSQTPIIAEYHLSFCDNRDRFVEPRGGRLVYGLINPSRPQPPQDSSSPSPTPTPTGVQQDDGTWTMSLSQMILACLNSMGVSNTNLPDLSTIDAPNDVKWFGNHAPTELAKLLVLANCVFCPDLANGGGSVKQIGVGDAPSFGADAIPVLSIPPCDRRGSAVIFSSYPTRVTQTEDIDGPDDSKWQFVVHDTDGTWQAIATATITGGDLPSLVRTNFASVDEAKREQLAEEAYRCIRLASSYVPPALSPMLRQAFGNDSAGKPVDLYVHATIAQLDPSTGLYSNSSGAVDVAVTHIHEGNVLQLERPIGKVSAATTDPNAYFQEVTSGITVHVSYEDAYQKDGKWYPLYFHCGFKLDSGGSVVAMAHDEISNAIDGAAASRDTFFVTRPDWRARTYNGANQNQSDLAAQGSILAAQYLANSSQPTKLYQRPRLPGRPFVWADLGDPLGPAGVPHRRDRPELVAAERGFRRWSDSKARASRSLPP